MTLKKIVGKTFPQWEKNRVNIGKLTNLDDDILDQVGVFYIKDKKTGKIVYIGKGAEYDNGGLRKRLSDFTRNSDSARDYFAGKMIHDNVDNVEVEVIPMGSTNKSAQAARELRDELKKRYNPIWNS